MENSVKDLIRRRKSVRTFNRAALRKEDRQKLEQYIQTLDNPFDVSVEFRFLDAKEYELSSPVIVGTDLYIAAKISRIPQSEIAYGYCFEKFCLYAEAMGIGTVMLAATISRKTFEKAMGVRDTEVMPAASPVGYPAEKRSVREILMRKGLKADERLPFGELFFEETFTESLPPEHAGQFRDALDMVRLAPSAGNKQPWRAVVCGDKVHFYEKKTKSMSDNPLGDIQKVDVGIALAHFDLTLKETGTGGRFIEENPGFKIDDWMEYIITYEVTY
ncbi:MAG: nitroreductase [Lachnospiraceae bacterium]|nr:nitroreductase [Lachnospiraceae bacterium]